MRAAWLRWAVRLRRSGSSSSVSAIVRSRSSRRWGSCAAIEARSSSVSGSGPAYFYFLIDTMLRTARDLGLSPEAAHTLVMDTARGAVALARDSDEPMEAMIARVRSPGGTTEAALEVLENKNVRDTFATAITTARNRAAELANEVGN